MKRLLVALTLLSSFVVSACGGGDPGPDLQAPTVVSTAPADGSSDAAPTTTIAITFSEGMKQGAGSIVITGGVEQVTLAASDGFWDGAGTTISFTPTAPFPYDAGITVTVETSFEDLAGNALAAPVDFTFQTAANPDPAPEVVSSVPAEGATGVSAAIDTIEILFSEAMSQSGSVTISGGPGNVDNLVWGGGGTILTIDVSGLAYDTDYKVTLTGFTDEVGIQLQGGALGDLALDFSTGPDVDSPFVVTSNPIEGQLDVDALTSTVTVTFSEPMDTTMVTAALSGAGTTTLSGSWDAAATTITFSLPEALEYETAYSLDLGGFADVIGNQLDGGPVLVDGSLDFVTAEFVDVFVPFLLEAIPAEGASVSMAVGSITLFFSEAMNTSVAGVEMTTTAGTSTITGTWDTSGTVLTFDVGFVAPGAVSLDVEAAGFTDPFGNPLDAAVLLFDGELDFTSIAHSGEDCSVPLLPIQGTPTPGGGLQWVVSAATLTVADGEFACDTSTKGADFVAEYTKVSGTLASGGELLYINAVTDSTVIANRLNVQVVSGACNPLIPASIDHKCLADKKDWSAYLDVPAGTYWIWVGKQATGVWAGNVTVTVDEVPASASEGEACFVPYSTATASPVYQPPLTSADPHRWNIPSSINSFDMDMSTGGPGSISCDTGTGSSRPGVDAVVTYTPASATNVIQVNLQSSSTLGLSLEMLDRCDAADPAAVSLRCTHDTATQNFIATNTGAPMFFWIATDLTNEVFPGAIFDIFEFAVGPGDSRGTAVPLTGSGPITKDSTVRLEAPSCFPATGSIDWFSFTPTGTGPHIVAVTPNAAGGIALVDGLGVVKRCSTNASAGNFAALVPAGGTIYIPIETASGITSLTIESIDYDGVEGIVESTGITFPEAELADYWLTIDEATGTLFLGTSGIEVFQVNIAGGVAIEHIAADGVVAANMGYAGVVANGDLFSADTTTVATTSRIYRLWDGVASPWTPTAWDTPASYPASSAIYSLAYDGTNIIFVTEHISQAAFYSLNPLTAGPPVLLGTSTLLNDCTGIAADDEFFYVACDDTVTVDGIFRLPRTGLSTTPLRLSVGSPLGIFDTLPMTAIALDDLANPEYLYFRTAHTGGGGIHAVARPDEAAPLYLGEISPVAGDADYGMTIDRTTGWLYQFQELGTSGATSTIQRVR